MTVEELNRLAPEAAREAFERCCGARAWVDRMIAGRPYRDRQALVAAADAHARTLRPADWLEAFEHHPRIGDVASLRERFKSTATWASDEQRGAAAASEATLAALAEHNHEYQEKFGYIFIVCATGKSADEMLGLLRARLPNDPGAELAIAAEEQMKITRIRLDKLMDGAS